MAAVACSATAAIAAANNANRDANHLNRVFEFKQCNAVHDSKKNIIRVCVGNMKDMKKATLKEAMNKVGQIIKEASPLSASDPKSGIVVVFDLRRKKNLDIFEHVTVIGKWIKRHEKFTEKNVRFTLVVTQPQEVNVFKMFVNMFDKTRPVFIDTRIKWEEPETDQNSRSRNVKRKKPRF